MDELCSKVTLFISDTVANRIPSESTENLLEQTNQKKKKEFIKHVIQNNK